MPSYIELDKQASFPSSSNPGKVIFGMDINGQPTFTDSSGNNFNFGTGSVNVSAIDTTYSELLASINSSSLSAGSVYRLTDYKSVNFLNGQEAGNDSNTADPGDADPTFFLNTSSLYDVPLAIKVQQDGKVLIASGIGDSAGAYSRSGLVRLNQDGTIDESFTPLNGIYNIQSIDIQPDNKILIANNSELRYTDTWDYITAATGSVLSNYYGTFYDAFPYNESVGSMAVGAMMIMRDTINNNFYKIKFTKWTQNGNGGGFAYTRQLITPAMDQPIITFEKTNYGAEVDVIVPGVLEITRNNSGAIYNIAEENGWDSGLSPKNTSWFSSWKSIRGIARLNTDGTYDTTFTNPKQRLYGWEDLTNMSSRRYGTYQIAISNNNNSLLTRTPLIMRDTDNNTYHIFKYLIYSNGTVTYKRQLITPEMDSPIIEFTHNNDNGDIDSISDALQIQWDWNNMAPFNPINEGSYNGNNPSNTQWNSVYVLIDHDDLRPDGDVYTIKAQPNGKIIVGGDFSYMYGTYTTQLVQYTASGSIDELWTSPINSGGTVHDTYTLPNEKILVAGNFGNTINLLKINSNGQIDNTFNQTTYNGPVVTIGVLSDQTTIMVGGSFNLINGSGTYSNIAAIAADGTILNTNFTTGFTNGPVHKLIIDSNDRIIVGGEFTEYYWGENGGYQDGMPYITRLLLNGEVDNTFNANNAAFNSISYISSLELTLDGKLYIGGYFQFTPYYTKTQSNIARLINDVQKVPENILVHTGNPEVLLLSAITNNELAPTAYSETYPQDVIQYNANINSLTSYQEFYADSTLPNGDIMNFSIKWDHENAQSYIDMPTGYPVVFGKDLFINEGFDMPNNTTQYMEMLFSEVKPGIQSCKQNFANVTTRIEISADGMKITLLDLGRIWQDRTRNQLYIEHVTKVADAYGLILRRHDTHKNNNIPFDYRSVKFRRYEINTHHGDIQIGYYGIKGKFDTHDHTGEFKTILSIPASNDVYNVNWQGMPIDVDNNVITDALYNVTITDSFLNNTFIGIWNSNFQGYINDNKGLNFYFNNVIYFVGNLLGSEFYLNDIHGDFVNNNIRSSFRNNVIRGELNSNTIGASFQKNTSTEAFSNNVVVDYFQNNTISTNISSYNFSSAYYVYEPITCNMVRTPENGPVLTFTDPAAEGGFVYGSITA